MDNFSRLFRQILRKIGGGRREQVSSRDDESIVSFIEL